MALFAVTTPMQTRNGDQVWFPFDCPDCDEPDDLFEQLCEEGIAIGDRLKVRKDNRGWLHEVERDRVIVGKPMVGMVTLMNRDRLVLANGK